MSLIELKLDAVRKTTLALLSSTPTLTQRKFIEHALRHLFISFFPQEPPHVIVHATPSASITDCRKLVQRKNLHRSNIILSMAVTFQTYHPEACFKLYFEDFYCTMNAGNKFGGPFPLDGPTHVTGFDVCSSVASHQ